MNLIRLGKSEVNGFFSVCDGDKYTLEDGSTGIVCMNGSGFWALRYSNADGKPDYTRPPIPEWENIDGQSAMVHMINRAKYWANVANERGEA